VRLSGADDACIITDQLIDNALCGYRFAGLPRILAIAREAKTRDTRRTNGRTRSRKGEPALRKQPRLRRPATGDAHRER
jgi:hypothetical protein